MNGNELTVIESKPGMALADVMQIGRVMSESGFFADSKDAAKSVVKILAGQELGFGPFASMTGIHIIQGRPSVGANLMAAAVKGSGRYDYRVTVMEDNACEVTFFERGQEIGKSKFTAEDAKRAGTQNLGKYPRNMLFARAMSNGVRWYCPDVFNGSSVYTPEELGAKVNEDGEIVAGTFEPEPPGVKVCPFAANDTVKAIKTGKQWTVTAVLSADEVEVVNGDGVAHVVSCDKLELVTKAAPTPASQQAAFASLPSASGAFDSE